MLSTLPVTVLLISASSVLAGSRPENVPSQLFSQRRTTSRVSDKDMEALQKLGMSSSQIQSMFGTADDVINDQRRNQQQVTDSSLDTQQQNQEAGEVEEYEYELYDTGEDKDVQLPGNIVNDNANWKANEEWWKDPLAMFDDEEPPQLNQKTQSIHEDKLDSMSPDIEDDISSDKGITDNNQDKDSSVEITQSSSSTTTIQPVSGSTSMKLYGLPLLFLRKSLGMSPTFFPVALSIILGKYMFGDYLTQQIKSLLHAQEQKDNQRPSEESSDTASIKSIDRDDEKREEDIDIDSNTSDTEPLQDLGFGRTIPKRRIQTTNVDTLSTNNSLETGGRNFHEKISSWVSRKKWLPLGRQNKRETNHQGDVISVQASSSDTTSDSSKMHKKGSLLFSGRKQMEEEVQKLQEEMELLREASLDSESKRMKSEAEYDRSRHEVGVTYISCISTGRRDIIDYLFLFHHSYLLFVNNWMN